MKAAILATQKQQNDERERVVVAHLREHLSDAMLFINGTELIDIGSKDPKTKVVQGLQQLIKTIYAKLPMLRTDYSDEDLKHTIQSRDQSMFPDGLDETEQEVLTRLQRAKTAHERSTVKSLTDTFAARPYGWPQIAILCILARLYKRNKVNVKLDGNNLDDRAVLEAFQKSAQFNSIILELEEEIPAVQMQKLKAFHQEYFNEPNLGSDPKAIADFFHKRIQQEVADFDTIYRLRHQFPFLESVGEPLTLLRLVSEKRHPYLYTAFDQYSEELLDDKESSLDAVKKFMNGP